MRFWVRFVGNAEEIQKVENLVKTSELEAEKRALGEQKKSFAFQEKQLIFNKRQVEFNKIIAVDIVKLSAIGSALSVSYFLHNSKL